MRIIVSLGLSWGPFMETPIRLIGMVYMIDDVLTAFTHDSGHFNGQFTEPVRRPQSHRRFPEAQRRTFARCRVFGLSRTKVPSCRPATLPFPSVPEF